MQSATTSPTGRFVINAPTSSRYRLRIAAVIRDYGMTDRAQAPADSRLTHEGQGAP